jgi:hypothetical protein
VELAAAGSAKAVETAGRTPLVCPTAPAQGEINADAGQYHVLENAVLKLN